MSRMVSFAVLIAIIVLISVLFFRVMVGFWLPLFLAALLVVIFKPVHRWILERCAGRVRLAAILTTLSILVVVLVPFGWAIAAAISEAANLYSRPRDAKLQDRIEELRAKFNLDMPFAELTNSIDYQFHRLQPPRDDETVLWENYNWSKARVRIDRLQEDLEALAVNVRVEYNPNAPDLKQSEVARRELLQVHLNHIAEHLTDLEATFPSAAGLRGEIPVPVASEAFNGSHTAEADGAAPAAAEVIVAPRMIEATPDPAVYLELLNQADLRFRTFRQALLGGPIWTWLVELANPSEQELREWRNQATAYIQHWLLSVTGQTTRLFGSLVFGLVIMIIAIYYFLIDGPTLIKAGMRLSPLEDQYELKLLAEFDKISRAVVLATLLSALVQGVLATIGYFFAGAHSLFLLFIVTVLLALVPFVGAAAVWVPVALWIAFVEGRVGVAIGLAIYGVLVVSMADNIIKPWVLHGQSNLHPLLALLSVLGGVQALGPIGILVGPMVVSFLQALLNILETELGRLEGRSPRTNTS